MTDPTLVSEETVILAKKGDLAAFNQIIVAFQKAIFNHLYRLTGSKEDAADLTQDTFFKLFRKRALINPNKNFKAYLYKIATNTAYDWFDKKKRRNEVNMAEEGEVETIEQQTPYLRMEIGNSVDLETAIRKIKPIYQNVIFLYYQQGFSYEELAEILKIPLGTVKTLLYRSKKALSEKLKPYE